MHNPQIAESVHLLPTIFDFGWNARIFLEVLRYRGEKTRGRRSLRTLLFVKLVEQGLGVFQIGGVDALGEPVVDFREHRARLVLLALLSEQTRETRRRAQLP